MIETQVILPTPYSKLSKPLFPVKSTNSIKSKIANLRVITNLRKRCIHSGRTVIYESCCVSQSGSVLSSFKCIH